MQVQSQSQKIPAIRLLKEEIAKDLVVDYVIDHLVGQSVFTEAERTEILGYGPKDTDDLMNRNQALNLQSIRFLDLLIDKMTVIDTAFNAFIYIIFHDGNYPWIGKRIYEQINELEEVAKLAMPLNGLVQTSPTVAATASSPPSPQLDAQPNSQNRSQPQEENNNNNTEITQQNVTSNVTLEDIAGYEEQIRKLKDLIEMPLSKRTKLRQMSTNWPKTALVFGPMGTGKTTVCKGFCNEFSCKMFAMYVNCGTVLNVKNVDQSKTNLQSIFKSAIEKCPSLVFLDNSEIICSRKKSDTGLVHVLGEELNNIPKEKHVVVILVTNKIEMIDDSIRSAGRIDREIEFPFPTDSERFGIFKKLLNRDNCDITDTELDRFARRADMRTFSGADLKLVCKEATMNAVKYDRPSITMPDLDFGLETVKSTTKRRWSVNFPEELSPVVDPFPQFPRQRSLTFVRSASTPDWPQPDPIAFVRLSSSERVGMHSLGRSRPQPMPSPARRPVGLSVFGPPGTAEAMIDRASSDTSINFLSLDLTPQESENQMLAHLMALTDPTVDPTRDDSDDDTIVG